MSSLRRALVLGAATTVLAGCAGAAKQAAPPAQAPAAVEPGGAAEPAFQQPTEGREEKKESPETWGGETGDGTRAIAGLDEAESALTQGETELATALSSAKDCATAKKALESMRRARERICDLQGPDDPGGRCTRASDQYDDARERVRRACGE